jgi:hypothetical protein
MTKQADMLAYVCDDQPHLLSGVLMQWMEVSPRFTVFVENYRDKIRKKIRLARGSESVLDLWGELQAAYCLLNDRRLDVAYEPYASAKRRAPDFAITYRANLVFNIEVARIRFGENPIDESDRLHAEERIRHILLDKLEQLQPGMANLLVINIHQELMRSIDLGKLMGGVKTRVEGKDPYFFAASRYTSPASFYKDFLHLSAIFLWGSGVQPWVNKQAQPGLADKIIRLVGSLLSEDSPV